MAAIGDATWRAAAATLRTRSSSSAGSAPSSSSTWQPVRTSVRGSGAGLAGFRGRRGESDTWGRLVAPRGIRACSEAGECGKATEEEQRLAAEFMEFVNRTAATWPLEGRSPTALMSPTAVVRVQMDALMRNDWPEEGSGVRTAFAFAMPARADELLAGQARPPVAAARTWEAAERFLSAREFEAMAHSPQYLPLLKCTLWEMASPMAFHGRGDSRSVQAVKVTATDPKTDMERSFTYTFCLEKVPSGAYKGCWMVVGVRCGDYANV